VQKRLMRALHGVFNVFDTGGVEPGNGFAGRGVARGIALAAAESPFAGNANR
jgi:nitrogenase subunit NifH